MCVYTYFLVLSCAFFCCCSYSVFKVALSSLVLLYLVLLILFYYSSLEACLFSNKRQKECGFRWEGKSEGLRGTEEGKQSEYII